MKAFIARRISHPAAPRRLLSVEALEDRRLLSTSPWQNPGLRLDVNKDADISPADVLVIINRLQSGGAGFLATPNPNPPQFYYDTSGDNILSPFDLLKVVNYLQSPPTAALSSLTPFTIDVTPQVTYTISGAFPADGTAIVLDADLNNDGDFSDTGELNRGQSTLYNGSSTFTMTTPLERSESIYKINLRTRVVSGDAPLTATLKMDVDTRTNTVLEDYVNAADPAYQYELVSKSTKNTVFGPYTYYVLSMTSQSWRSAEEVDKPTWTHWIEIYQPADIASTTAILLIDGGSNNSGPPAATDQFGLAAIFDQTTMIHLRGVPSEPLIFDDEPGNERSEDEIIAYSFDKFLNNVDLENPDDPNVKTWPVLIAMTKAAVRTMDTAQDFMAGGVGKADVAAPIDDFLVTGYSKRGWTTWLTAAVDDRVRAIIPGVFDNLNQGEQMVHHFGAYGFFSEAVQDYNDLQIFDRINSPQGLELSQITDPYRYLNNGRFDDMPKLVMNSAGDEFFVSDSSQFYFHDLPGTQNYLRYVPNVGHGMGLSSGNTTTLESTVAFYDAVANNLELPQFTWTIAQDGTISVHTDTAPIAVKLWQITNPDARDFRRAATPTIDWTSTGLADQGNGNYSANLDAPGSGARAYFIELTFASGTLFPHIFTTDINVKAVTPWHDWPFESGFPPDPEPLVSPLSASAVDTISAGLVMAGNRANGAADGSAFADAPADDLQVFAGAILSASPTPVLGPAIPLGSDDAEMNPSEVDPSEEELAEYLVDDDLLQLLV